MRIITQFLFLVSSFYLGAQTADLTITIPNIKEAIGVLQIGLYNVKEDFPKVGKEFKRYRVDLTEKNFEYTLTNLELAAYGIAIYHDENNDNECNRNFLGIPKEDYGFSNNVKPFLKAPSFNAVKIDLVRDTLISIILR